MSFAVKQLPKGRRDNPTYYALADGKAHWTQFKELAKPFSESEASHMMTRLNRGGLSKPLVVVPI